MIMPRRSLVELYAVLAGVIFDFARFRASMVPLRNEMVLSCPFGGGVLVAIVNMVVARK